ncbi:hypothetical protein G7074_09025 [Pedobacter sp. HDW13]|uniref:SecDF P1 head subdomain-containing protein n=1 Tax=unclassified Pedobacter TaxID=2628915 RepID=UPI000F5A4874|nr:MULTISPECIES: hypothetical protein [unclassified Pedobacter]QIL39405.1 hypothetical protein G7074_09025 [Pedobacter sp. HDW13]RQO71047.1 hypothetical protein DBR40_17575 [Pedobacter sp. KBW01]
MKALVNTILILIISFGNALSDVPKNKLQSGWYLITDNKTSTSIKLNKSDKVYMIEKEIFISVKSIAHMEVAMERYGNRNNPILNFTLDSDASSKLGSLSSGFNTNRQMGLIINNKLIQVVTIFGEFSGNKISLAGKFTKEELLKLKTSIEDEKH